MLALLDIMLEGHVLSARPIGGKGWYLCTGILVRIVVTSSIKNNFLSVHLLPLLTCGSRFITIFSIYYMFSYIKPKKEPFISSYNEC